jgi:hypothetical protein
MKTDRTDHQFMLMTTRQAVDKLTRPYRQDIMQETDGPDGETTVKKSYITLHSLLDQLDSSIGSSNSATARGGGDPSTRSVLDASALMLMHEIEQEAAQIWEFLNGTRIRPANTKLVLRRIYTKVEDMVAKKTITTETLTEITHTYTHWANQIEAKFDPPVTIVITKPCPKCDVTFVFDEYNDRTHALVIYWRKSFEQSEGVCLACGNTWLGQNELRQLRWELDQNDTQEEEE